jgi:hypothetical protein
MHDHLMKLESMDIDPSSPTREDHSRVLQINARSLWLKPPDLVRAGRSWRAFLFLPPAFS